ncbi:MAG: hypothetical protein OXR07_02875 [Nitrospira sp.]|nr:hypothetical protein [Nitrospira sp.]MDD9860035.1 hypothetical protein [Nitrospira sp.]
MQTLDVNHPELPDLQFALMVLALCTSDIPTLNVPEEVRNTVFDRCWALLHATPPPTTKAQRVLDLRQGDAVTLDALVTTIRTTLTDHGYTQLTWDHVPSEPTQRTSPEAQPLIDRLRAWNPMPSPPEET